MVDAKYGSRSRRRGSSSDAADLRGEEARRNTGHHDISGKAVEIWDARTDGVAGDFRTIPFYGIGDRGAAQHAKIERLVGVLPNVLAIDDQVFSEGLLKTGVELIAVARTQWRHAG